MNEPSELSFFSTIIRINFEQKKSSDANGNIQKEAAIPIHNHFGMKKNLIRPNESFSFAWLAPQQLAAPSINLAVHIAIVVITEVDIKR